ncbi:LEA family epithelial adhesin, partial [Limosilactobacillus reuteri]|uniref:LEA family epithelial adhesin n=1 Tax=Limosilactobacillus reuteri TaxID=1598 RepID=UPI00298C1B16
MNKQRNFEETKRTPHYGLRKLNVGVASVLLGVTVFGINVALDPAKAAANATEPTQSVIQQVNDPTGNVTTTGSGQNPASTEPTQSVTQQVNDPTGNVTTTGSGQNPASVDENNINTQTQAKNNQLAKETGLTSSDNSSSNIYMGTDGNYYKVVTIYGNDYVYRPVKVYANGTATGQYATNERDTRTNIVTSKEDLGNGKVHWKITFFPAKGLTKYKSTLSGLQSAKFGVALTKDYKIIGDVTVNIDSIADAYHTYTAITGHGSRGDHEFTPEAHVVQSFNPNTDVDLSGWINSSTMPGENNDYILGPYYFTTENSVGKQNLGNTFFREETVKKNVYTQQPFVGDVHDLWTDNYTIRNENKNALDGGDYVDKHLIYDPLYNGRYDHTDGFFNSDDFGSAMIFKSHGKTGAAQFASFTISFDTQHTDSYQSELAKGPKDRPQQFSGIIANTYSYQNGYYNMYSISLGEQRSLKKVGAKYVPTEPGDVVSNWKKGQEALAKINQKYLNKAQIDTLSNAIHSNIDDEDTVDQIITIGNNLNDAMKALGNSVGQYDGAYADHVVDTVKQSDRYLNADPKKQSAYDQAVEAAQKVLDKEKGQYADQLKVEKLTTAVNDAWEALNGSTIPTQKVVVADPLKLTPDELDQIKQKVAAVNPGTTVEVAPNGSVTIKRGDQVLTPIASDQLVIGQTKVDDPKNLTPTEQGEVKQKVSTAYQSLGVTNVTISNDGTATVTLQRTVTLPSESVTIPGTDLVVKKTDAEKHELKVPGDKVKVDDPTKLTDNEKNAVKDKVDEANPNLPDGTKVTVGDNGDVTVTYPDGSKDTTITGDKVVEGKTDAEKHELKVPGDKVKVDDPTKLT